MELTADITLEVGYIISEDDGTVEVQLVETTAVLDSTTTAEVVAVSEEADTTPTEVWACG